MADEYADWEPDELELGEEEQDEADNEDINLADRVKRIENAQKAKEEGEKADSIRAAFLNSLPDNQRGLAAVGVAGAETPAAMKSQIKKVQSLLKDTFPDALIEGSEGEGEDSETDDEQDAFAPVGSGMPVIPRPVAEQRETALRERIAAGGPDASRAALAMWLKDSPVFGDVVKDW
jgi:hypothetical protein